MTDTHAYLGPCHSSDSQDKNKGTMEKSPSVDDIPESGHQEDYTEITDDNTGAASGGSVTTAKHGMNIQGGRTPQHASDKPIGEYNRLGGGNVTTTDAKHTHNRLRDTNADVANLRQTVNHGSAADYFVLEESKDNYNRLGDGATITTTDANRAYYRLGDTTDEAGNPELTDTAAPSSDYFVLDEPEDTYNKLGVDGAATTTDEKNTYHRLGNTDVDTRNGDSEHSETLLEKSGGTYNKIGEKPSA
ncbi:uncharacterized protein [Haliotis cracherodii]|uniref:uncharacterized protein n=1 Tax=Haliotis cracherodii TaxID=6455 RepID=UPI0039E8B9BE